MEFKTLLVEKKSEYILLVTLNRPERRNAINIDMMHDLLHFWEWMSEKNNTTRCVILTGKDTAFCAGADLKERKEMNLEIWRGQHAVLQKAMRAMVDCPIPIIAAVNGAAFGGGLELTMASDFAYASTAATFAQSEVKIGIMPGAMGTQNLPNACGLRRAKELTFTAQTFSAQEAFEWGIINKLCSPEKLLEEVTQTAIKISENAPLAVKHVKKALNASQHLDIHSGFTFEVDAYNQLLMTEDRVEGIAAFNEKRKPNFSGK
jgi:enoyl-CoA hydratase